MLFFRCSSCASARRQYTNTRHNPDPRADGTPCNVIKSPPKSKCISIWKNCYKCILSQYFGDPITCWHEKDQPEDYFNQYCWLHGSSHIPEEYHDHFGCRVSQACSVQSAAVIWRLSFRGICFGSCVWRTAGAKTHDEAQVRKKLYGARVFKWPPIAVIK